MTTKQLQESRTELATFYVGEALCGMKIKQIQEIIRLSRFTRVSQAPTDVLGILNLRGQIITVLDLANRLGLGTIELTTALRVIIVNSNGGQIGILVHRISDVASVNLDEQEPAPANMHGIQGSYFTGVCKRDTGLIGLLDINRVVSHEDP